MAKYNLDENRDGVPDNLRIVSDFVQAGQVVVVACDRSQLFLNGSAVPSAVDL